jgi:hypothetical protein
VETRQLITGLSSFEQELGNYAYSLSILDWLKSLFIVGGPNQLMSGRLLDPNHQQRIKEVTNQLEELLTIDDIPEDQLSSKVIALNKLLIKYKEEDDRDDFLCIVFVERRQHTQLLLALLERNAQLKGFIRPGALAGHGGGNENDLLGIKMDSRTVGTCSTLSSFLY